jgi:hypothetical protein
MIDISLDDNVSWQIRKDTFHVMKTQVGIETQSRDSNREDRMTSGMDTGVLVTKTSIIPDRH